MIAGETAICQSHCNCCKWTWVLSAINNLPQWHLVHDTSISQEELCNVHVCKEPKNSYNNVLQVTGNLSSFEQLFSKQTYVSLLPSVFSSTNTKYSYHLQYPLKLDPFRSLAKTHQHQKETDTYMQTVTLWEICHSTYLSIYASCVQATCSNFPSIVLQYVKFHACFLWNVKFLC